MITVNQNRLESIKTEVQDLCLVATDIIRNGEFAESGDAFCFLLKTHLSYLLSEPIDTFGKKIDDVWLLVLDAADFYFVDETEERVIGYIYGILTNEIGAIVDKYMTIIEGE